MIVFDHFIGLALKGLNQLIVFTQLLTHISQMLRVYRNQSIYLQNQLTGFYMSVALA